MKRFVSLVALGWVVGVSTVAGQCLPAGQRPAAQAVLQSGVVDTAGYDEETKTLTVLFRSGWLYTYEGVPAAVFSGLVNAQAPGAFFVKNIRGKYPACRVSCTERWAGIHTNENQLN